MSKQNGIENDENQISIFDILYPERKNGSNNETKKGQNGKDRTIKKGNRTSEK